MANHVGPTKTLHRKPKIYKSLIIIINAVNYYIL